MIDLIGQDLNIAKKQLEENSISHKVVNNNHNVNGDIQLITNAVEKDNTVILTVGDFIFNLKD